MNTRTSLSLLLAAVTLAVASPLSAGTKTSAAFAHQVGAVERNSSTTIQRGSTRHEVQLALGAPRYRLNADTWVYPGYNGGIHQAASDNSDLLIVSFKNARVTELRLVNAPAVQIIAAQLQPRTAPTALVAKNN